MAGLLRYETERVSNHESFFRDAIMVLPIKVFNRAADSFRELALPVTFTCVPYFVTNA